MSEKHVSEMTPDELLACAPCDFLGFAKLAKEPIFNECQIHGKYQVVFEHHPICPVCAEEQTQKLRAEQLRQHERERDIARYAASGVPSRYQHAGLKNFEIRNDGQRRARDAIARYARAVTESHSGGLILSGRTGTGKTHLAIALLRNVMRQIPGRTPMFARYITSADLADHLLEAWKRPDDSTKATRLRMCDPELLVIDEYGLDDRKEVQTEAVHRVLYDRYDAKKPTILISNESPESLQKMLGQRLWSRLNDGGELIQFNWEDQRAGVRHATE